MSGLKFLRFMTVNKSERQSLRDAKRLAESLSETSLVALIRALLSMLANKTTLKRREAQVTFANIAESDIDALEKQALMSHFALKTEPTEMSTEDGGQVGLLSRARLKKFFPRFISTFTDEQQVWLKHLIHAQGRLNYPNAEIKMYLSSPASLARTYTCDREPETVQWIEENIQEGDVFYDIGANVGAFSLIFAAIQKPDSVIYAFEPSFSTFDELCHNIYINQFSDRIIPFQVALSNETRVLPFYYSDIVAGKAMHVVGEPVNEVTNEPFQSTYVQHMLAYRLDDMIEQFQLRPPTLVKIDVDNGTLDVLLGARKVLSMPSVRSILVEVCKHSGFFEEASRILAECGFEEYEEVSKANKNVANFIFKRTTSLVSAK